MPTHAPLEAPIGERPDFFRRIQEMLGIRRLKSDHDLVKLVDAGLPIHAIESLRRHGLSDDEIYGLELPRRTFALRRARRESLSRDESDRVVRIPRIAALGEQVFGDQEAGSATTCPSPVTVRCAPRLAGTRAGGVWSIAPCLQQPRFWRSWCTSRSRFRTFLRATAC